MTISSANWARALFPGLHSWYGLAYDKHPVEYTDLFNEEKSNRAYEEIMGTTGFGLAAIKTEGSPITYDDNSQAYLSRVSHLVYALGFVITREMVEDNLYAQIGKQRSEDLAFSIRTTVEQVHANVYNRAFNSSYTGGDGKELLATDHPNFSGGTWANELSTAADLSEAALEQASIDIMKWENDRGLPISVIPQTLIVPPDLVFEAERILKSPYRVGTADNDLNALNSMGKFPGGVKVNHYLTSSKAWFLRTNAPKGMISFLRRGMEFDVDNDFHTENAYFKASIRFAPGWGDPRGLFGSPGQGN